MTKEQIIELAKQMTAAPSCCAPLKAATQAWLAALGTENEKELARKFIEELEGDITDIDNLVAFAHSDIAVKYFGEDGAKKFAAHAARVVAERPPAKLRFEEIRLARRFKRPFHVKVVETLVAPVGMVERTLP